MTDWQHERDARFKPNGAPTYVVCYDCADNGWGPMIQDNLWKQIEPPGPKPIRERFLCQSCMEKRLGRELRREDLKLVPMNAHHPLNLPTTLGESISLINTVDVQRFWLPDRNYIYDMRIVSTRSGKVWRHTIIHNETKRNIEFVVNGRAFEHFDVPVAHREAMKLNLYAQELAARKYPRPPRRSKGGYKLKEAIIYNVVDTRDKNKGLMEGTFFLNQAQQFKAVQTVKYPDRTFEIVEIERGK